MTLVLDGMTLDARGASYPVRLLMEGGRIASAMPGQAGADRLILPGFANAHDHARPLSPTSFGAANKPLESWLLRLAAMTRQEPYLAAAAPLARAARSGCTSIMVHYTRAQGPMPLPDEAREVARAAGDVGVQVAFAVAMRDMNPLVYGDPAPMLAAMPTAARAAIEAIYGQPLMSFKEQLSIADAVAEATGNPRFSVQYGPNGMQWCSRAMLEAIAEASENTGRRVHMHFLETKYQRAWADRHCPQGAARYLKEIGLLSERLTLAHCVWANEDDLALIAESGAIIATNASSNLHLKSGIAPIGKAIAMGCKVAIGLDGAAFDEDDDMVREIRLGAFLHGGWGYDTHVSREDYLFEAIRNGRLANGALNGTGLAAGDGADIVEIDLTALDTDTVMPIEPIDYLFARANRTHVARVIADGRVIVERGRVLGVDLPAVEAEMRARYRAQMPSRAEFLDAWPSFDAALSGWYRDRLGCC
ncbi:MAG: amidohydrolase family protein [Rhizobiales bacterium]|nr:amidohydrolase family protein [Hyphomicrobiales bacterium]